MPRRVLYTVPWTGTVTNAGGNTDLWELTPASNKPISIAGIRLGQISEVGDAAEEGLIVRVIRMRATVTSGSGGSAGAPEDVSLANQAPSFSSETNNTTVATTSGDTEVIDLIPWNIRNSPFEIWYPEPELQPAAGSAAGEVLIVRLDTTVADDITGGFNIWVWEG
jgi:hypothetical protein